MRRRGSYKNPFPFSPSFTLEEESQQGGSAYDSTRDPPSPQPTPLYLPTTGVLFPTSAPSQPAHRGLSLLEELPSTDKCQEKQHKRQQIRIAAQSRRERVKETRREKQQQQEKAHGSSPLPFSMHTLCARGTMKPEINAAVGFLSRFLRVKGHVNDRQVQTFSQSLQDILAGKETHKNIQITHRNHRNKHRKTYTALSHIRFRPSFVCGCLNWACNRCETKPFFVLPSITISATSAHHCLRTSKMRGWEEKKKKHQVSHSG